MVAAPWRRLAHAARWNGRPPHSTTGAARASAGHSQPSNRSAGTIDIRRTGSERTAETTSRRRSEVPRSPGIASPAASPRGRGRRAPKPASSTASTSRSGATRPGSKATEALSVA